MFGRDLLKCRRIAAITNRVLELETHSKDKRRFVSLPNGFEYCNRFEAAVEVQQTVFMLLCSFRALLNKIYTRSITQNKAVIFHFTNYFIICAVAFYRSRSRSSNAFCEIEKAIQIRMEGLRSEQRNNECLHEFMLQPLINS